MSSIKQALSSAASFTITLNSLASSTTAGRESTAIDNTSNLYLDALVEVLVSFPNSAPANDKAIYVYAYDSVDGTNYSGAVTGSDAAYTMDDPTVLALIGVIPIPTQNKSYRSRGFSVAAAFGGVLPPKWGIFVRNYAGQTLNGSGCSAQWVGVSATVLQVPVLASTRTTRPGPAARVAFGHPLAMGLLAAFLFNDGPGSTDKVTGLTRMAPATGTSFSELGLHATATDLGAEVTTPTRLQVGIPHTIAAYATFRGTPDVNGFIFGITNNNTDSNPYQSTGLSLDASVQVQHVGNTAGTFTTFTSGVTAASLLNVPSLIVATITGSARKLWINGVLKASTSGISAPTYGASSLVAAGDYTGVSRNSAVVVHAGYLWNRELTGDEIMRLSAQPYSVVQPPVYRWEISDSVATASSSRMLAFF